MMKIIQRFLVLLVALSSVLVMGTVSNTHAATTLEADQYVIFYHNDLLGSPAVVTDHNGNTLWHEHSDPYGRARDRVSETGEEFQHDRVESRKGYTGHLKDDGTNLVYMKARFYDPQIGRFYSNDPARFSSSRPAMFNRYSHANNNPYKYIDPDGREVVLTLPEGSRTREAYINLKYSEASADVISKLENSSNTYHITEKDPLLNVTLNMTNPGFRSEKAFAVEKGVDGKPTVYIEAGVEADVGAVGQKELVRISHEAVLYHEIGHLAEYENGVPFSGRNRQKESDIWGKYDNTYNQFERSSGGEFVSSSDGPGFWSSLKSFFGYGTSDDE